MAVEIGTSSGFVAVAPTADPEGSAVSADFRAHATADTSPATAAKIIEVGWWCDSATEAANFEVGLYADDGAVVPDEAGTLLEVSRTNAKGTTAGWKRVTGLNWAIDPDTVYWLAMQLDNTASTTRTYQTSSAGIGYDRLSNVSTLPNPFGGGALIFPGAIISIYAVWEEAATGTNMQINIGDVWKEVPAIQINIGDVWKEVVGIQQNIGDVWKEVF